jgi:hypothetical protein
MKSTRILLVTLGCAVTALVVALAWKRQPETIDIPSYCTCPPLVPPSDSQTATELTSVTPPVAGDRSSSDSHEAKTSVTQPIVPREQLWAEQYAALDEEQLRARSEKLLSDLSTRSGPELQKLHEAGVYEVVGESTKYTLKPNDNDLSGVMSIVMLPASSDHPNGQVHRVVLPESRYPDLWALQDEYNWMTKRADELRHAAAALNNGSPAPH